MLESLYVLAIAFLMASRVPHFSGKSIGRVPREHMSRSFWSASPRRCCCVVDLPDGDADRRSRSPISRSIPFAVRRYRALRSASRRRPSGRSRAFDNRCDGLSSFRSESDKSRRRVHELRVSISASGDRPSGSVRRAYRLLRACRRRLRRH